MIVGGFTELWIRNFRMSRSTFAELYDATGLFCRGCCITFFQMDVLPSDSFSSRSFKVNGNAPTTVGHFSMESVWCFVFFSQRIPHPPSLTEDVHIFRCSCQLFLSGGELLLPFPHFTSSSSSSLWLLSLRVPS